jgi:hypothetical protein
MAIGIDECPINFTETLSVMSKDNKASVEYTASGGKATLDQF